MARRRGGDPEFGSDSFLDIVANIVGILIILIVVAGLRIAQMPAVLPMEMVESGPALVEPEVLPELPPTPLTPPPAPRPAKIKKLAPVVAPRPVIVEVEPEPPKAPQIDQQLLAAQRQAEDELRRLTILVDQEDDTSAKLAQFQTAAERKLAAERQRLAALQSRIEDQRQRTASVETQVAKLNAIRELADQRIEELEEQPTIRLEHELTPVGTTVQGTEIHFMISGGKISRVPLDELVSRLEPEIRRQLAWLARNGRGTGEVGPIDGFSMIYVVERGGKSILDELAGRATGIRISVAGWKVLPEPNYPRESVDEALRSDSRFRSQLRLAPRVAALTFWVYPDSYAEFREFQAYAHQQGFTVAARPLPEGVPIAGSPRGSKSQGR
ncbi:hypothetical protein [Stratiformator vulcanicus]|uniref:Uncharacterized protein n=1 Tax=Stratiformator vulcanicus TaxID=2527980 RepID=A0A517R2P6_9PLAN|nr:hypothetical protein [Stratiformator vulcanicus]QDT38160.1 hypothetical protein Pan189_25500 [Stratiformator vulcanicus]